MDKTKKLDLLSAATDAWNFYTANFLVLVCAGIVFQFLSAVSVLILSGPLLGGFLWMVLQGDKRAGKKTEFSDLFYGFKNRIFSLIFLFFIEMLLTAAGYMMLIVPGILLSAMWIYSFLMMLDRENDIVDSMKASWNAVNSAGIAEHVLLVIFTVVVCGILPRIPVAGILINIAAVPYCLVLLVFSYKQVAGKGNVEKITN